MRLIILIAVFAAGNFVGVYAERGFGVPPDGARVLDERPAREGLTESPPPPVAAGDVDTEAPVAVPATSSPRGGLSDAQRSLVRSFGLDPDTITVTEGMLSCARDKLGAARYDELLAGALPSLTESVSLLSCYRQ
jgi:hypothetical protein